MTERKTDRQRKRKRDRLTEELQRDKCSVIKTRASLFSVHSAPLLRERQVQIGF